MEQLIYVGLNQMPWQGHEFSFRDMSGLEDSVISGARHLLSFTGSDSVSVLPAIIQ